MPAENCRNYPHRTAKMNGFVVAWDTLLNLFTQGLVAKMQKSTKIGLPAMILLILACCSNENKALDPNEIMMNYFADSLICIVDTSLIEELERQPPSGYQTKYYSPKIWQELWNNHFHNMDENGPEENAQYQGPTGDTIVKYTLRLRREMGLSDIIADARNKDYLGRLYQEVNIEEKTSCEIIHWPSPVCGHSPPQFPNSPPLQMGCTV